MTERQYCILMFLRVHKFTGVKEGYLIVTKMGILILLIIQILFPACIGESKVLMMKTEFSRMPEWKIWI